MLYSKHVSVRFLSGLALAATLWMTAATTADATERSRVLSGPPQSHQESIAIRAQLPECQWTGQRIIQALMRDDVIAGRDHLQFFNEFNCPSSHLAEAFGCALEGIESAETSARQTLVMACWQTLKPPPAEPATSPEDMPAP